MAVSCDKSDLISAAVCYACLAERELCAIRIYLLCSEINGTPVNCDPKSLLAAAVNAGYMDYSSKEMLAVETYLQCQLASGGGGGGGSVQLVVYTSGTPANPADVTQPALAYDPNGIQPILGWGTISQTWGAS